jgi:hypothetical protein
MNASLSQINALYARIGHLFDPSPEFITMLDHLSDTDLARYAQNQKKVSAIYASAIHQLQQLLPLLSHEEIIEGYQQGSTLLQRNLSGYMATYFDASYISIMIEAIESDHSHTAWVFLQALADNIGKSLSHIYTGAI